MQSLLLPALILTLIGVLSTPLQAAETDWALKKDDDGITIYTRSVEGSRYKAVRAEMLVDGTVTALTALVLDSERCAEWAAHCKSSTALKTLSDTHFIHYTLNDLPWPVADREGITDVRWAQDAADGTVTMTATLLSGDDVPPETPSARGAVRLTTGTTSWAFTPAEAGKVRVVSEAHIDPEGATPAWLTNRLLVGAPFETMVAMRTLLGSGRYNDARVPWIAEP